MKVNITKKYGPLQAKYKPRAQPRNTPAVKIPLRNSLSLEERVRVIRYFDWFGSYWKAEKFWRKEFKEKPPNERAFKEVVTRFNETGSIWKKKVVRKKTTIENEEEIAEFVKEALMHEPNRTTESLAEEKGVTVDTIHKIRKKYRMPEKTFADPLVHDLKKKIAKLEKYIEDKTGAPAPPPRRWARVKAINDAKIAARQKDVAAKKKKAATKRSAPNKSVRRSNVKRKPILDLPYLRKFSLEERIRMVHYFGSPMRWSQMVEAWKTEFGTNAPPRLTFRKVNQKFEQTGSVEDIKSVKTPIKMAPKDIANYYTDALKKDPTCNVGKIAAELGISKAYLTGVRTAFGIPTKPFILKEVVQLRHRIFELEDEIKVIDGKKVRKIRRKPGDPKPQKPLARKQALTFPGTSAASVRAKKARFMFPLECDGLEDDLERAPRLTAEDDSDDPSSGDDSDSESSTSTIALDHTNDADMRDMGGEGELEHVDIDEEGEEIYQDMAEVNEDVEEVYEDVEEVYEEVEKAIEDVEEVYEDVEEVIEDVEEVEQVEEVDEDMLEDLELHELTQEDYDQFNQG